MENKDLKTGMVIEKYSGTLWMIFKDVPNMSDFMLHRDCGWKDLSSLDFNEVRAVWYPTTRPLYRDFFQPSTFDRKTEDMCILLWQCKPHTIQIDGKEIELSEERYQNIKKHFKE